MRILLKDYNLLNADEKIKCLQKQQSIQAEIEAHEPIIQRIIQVVYMDILHAHIYFGFSTNRKDYYCFKIIMY